MTRNHIEEKIAAALIHLGLTLSVAESCTGGLICDRLTNYAGSSRFFLGGIVSYSNKAKIKLLGVRQTTLDSFGAVSKETVVEMAQGVRMRLDSDLGLAVSGIAGPDGGTMEKPVGYTWIGLSTANNEEHCWQHTWQGNRLDNKKYTCEAALSHLYEHLMKHLKY